eukprot:CAMPEP_0175122934 /NCGR_PEP_ID=MMETSP0087-20121206/1974_1 /TAXON_ID=136419 /ORGANISM="Unknown Unknown, Strain D1" /LENGTH=407 /DNA_ID=CAMNT_0016404591 /DNA_START=621 /DNA_END=1844 /DNA_ORIENTATION=+
MVSRLEQLASATRKNEALFSASLVSFGSQKLRKLKRKMKAVVERLRGVLMSLRAWKGRVEFWPRTKCKYRVHFNAPAVSTTALANPSTDSEASSATALLQLGSGVVHRRTAQLPVSRLTVEPELQDVPQGPQSSNEAALLAAVRAILLQQQQGQMAHKQTAEVVEADLVGGREAFEAGEEAGEETGEAEAVLRVDDMVDQSRKEKTMESLASALSASSPDEREIDDADDLTVHHRGVHRRRLLQLSQQAKHSQQQPSFGAARTLLQDFEEEEQGTGARRKSGRTHHVHRRHHRHHKQQQQLGGSQAVDKRTTTAHHMSSETPIVLMEEEGGRTLHSLRGKERTSISTEKGKMLKLKQFLTDSIGNSLDLLDLSLQTVNNIYVGLPSQCSPMLGQASLANRLSFAGHV